MSEDMESKGIFFDVQWKTKTGVPSGEEFASIGIWEVDDSSLDWMNFRPYLCQTLGNVENLSISYVDSDGDVIPIDSDCEFQEALKFARRKAAMGQKVILKVEKLDSQSAATGGTELSSSPIYIKSSNFIKERFKIHTSSGEEHNPFRLSGAEGPVRIGNLSCKVKSKTKTKDVLCPLQSCDSPPMWFKKYMQKMKGEIISEVTANVSCQVKKMLEDLGHKGPPIFLPTGSCLQASPDFTDAWLVAKTKKKISDDDSSDGAHKVEIRDSKILKKIEKLHRREKKLDHKKEKLEQKTKKIAERKEREYLSKLRLERAGCKRSHNESLSHRVREWENIMTPRRKMKEPGSSETTVVPTQDQEAALLAVEVHVGEKRTMSVKRGSKFTKTWKVVNSGNVPWTDETEVRLSWGNAGLDPEAVMLKCPPLSPGEEGEIAINFIAPEFPGLFESHWHFFHNNVRFGSSISCIISVDLISNSEDEARTDRNLSSASTTEFCVVPSAAFAMEGEKEKLTGNETQNIFSSVTEETLAGSVTHEKILPKINSFSSASVPWGAVDDRDETAEKEGTSQSDKRKEMEFESISTDDLSASIASIGSDSDDNFVVVPMPPCFRFDVPLNADPISPKMDKIETKEAPVSPNHQQLIPLNESVSNEIVETPSASSELSAQERSEVSRDTGEVISVPVIAPETPLVAELRRLHVVEASIAPTPPCTIQPMPSPTSINAPRTPSTSPRGSPLNSGPRRPPPPTNIPTSRTRSGSRPVSSPSTGSPRPIDLMPPVVSEVWNGAMNATASALNSAFAALDSILVNPTGSSNTHGQVYSVPPQDRPFDEKMIDSLSKLTSMGFFNIELNEALLRVHNHNLSEVIDLLLDREDPEPDPR